MLMGAVLLICSDRVLLRVQVEDSVADEVDGGTVLAGVIGFAVARRRRLSAVTVDAHWPTDG